VVRVPCSVLPWVFQRTARRRRGWTGRVAVVVLIASLFAVEPAPGSAGGGADESGDVAARARRIEGQLIAPCCFSQTVDNHSSPLTEEIKRDIRQRLGDGQSEAAILEAYRERYGERILAAPRARGFNLLAYVMPPVFLVAGLVLGGMWLRRRVRQPVADGQPPTPVGDPRLRARLDAELARVEP